MAHVLTAEEVLTVASETFLGKDYFRDAPEMSNAGRLVAGNAAGREAGVRVGERDGVMTVRVFVPGSSALSQSMTFPADEATEDTVVAHLMVGVAEQARW